MSDQHSKLYWDPLRDDRWNLSLWAWRGAAGDTWYVIRRWCHGRRWLPPHPSPPHYPHTPSTCVENGSSVSGSQRTFISPHLCGLRRDDLGLKPSQPSCHLRKKWGDEQRGGGKIDRNGWEGRGWRKLSDLCFTICSTEMFDMFLLDIQQAARTLPSSVIICGVLHIIYSTCELAL